MSLVSYSYSLLHVNNLCIRIMCTCSHISHCTNFLDPLHLEMVVMNQGIQLTKLEQEIQFMRSQQEIIMQKLVEMESWFRSSHQQLSHQQLVSTPRHHHHSISPNPHKCLQLDQFVLHNITNPLSNSSSFLRQQLSLSQIH